MIWGGLARAFSGPVLNKCLEGHADLVHLTKKHLLRVVLSPPVLG